MCPELDPLMRTMTIIYYHILSLLFIVQHIQPAAALITGGLGPEPWPNLAGWMAGSRASRPRGSPIEPAPVQAGQRRSWSTWKEAYNPNGGGVRWGYHGIPKLVPYGAIWCHRVDPKMVDPSRPEQLWFFGIYLGTIWCHIAGKWSLSGGIQEASQFSPSCSQRHRNFWPLTWLWLSPGNTGIYRAYIEHVINIHHPKLASPQRFPATPVLEREVGIPVLSAMCHSAATRLMCGSFPRWFQHVSTHQPSQGTRDRKYPTSNAT